MSDACCAPGHSHSMAPAPPVNVFREHARDLWILAGSGVALGLGGASGWLGFPSIALPAYLLTMARVGLVRAVTLGTRRATLEGSVVIRPNGPATLQA